ncbi:alpha/beta fold hydrolase [Nonomuraea jabiensis]|uniref:alpha/beta fold hydrolase n=1 Tax=Nonomuraea jabiensis TaxID=882448 RepID=UPI0036B15DF2
MIRGLGAHHAVGRSGSLGSPGPCAKSSKDFTGLRAGFAFYRALDTTIAQNQRREARRLAIPVLAIAGANNSGDLVEKTMRLAADDGESVIIPDCDHCPAEEAPEEMLAALKPFLTAHRLDAIREERVPNCSPGRPPSATRSTPATGSTLY